jgi:K+-sensing histidine kinase KdpD
MIYSAETDIVPFVRCLACGLQSYASANEVSISFSSGIKKQLVHYHPFLLSQSVVQLMCNVINLVPPQSKISVRLFYDADHKNLQVEIENSGINLIRVNEVCTHTIYQFAGSPLPNGTLYRLALPLHQQK